MDKTRNLASDRYTLSCEALKIYTFRKKSGSLSVAEDRAIAALLHPQPDEQMIQMIKIQSFCVVLSDQLALFRQENAELKERIARLENQMEKRSQNEHESKHHTVTASMSTVTTAGIHSFRLVSQYTLYICAYTKMVPRS